LIVFIVREGDFTSNSFCRVLRNFYKVNEDFFKQYDDRSLMV